MKDKLKLEIINLSVSVSTLILILILIFSKIQGIGAFWLQFLISVLLLAGLIYRLLDIYQSIKNKSKN